MAEFVLSGGEEALAWRLTGLNGAFNRAENIAAAVVGGCAGTDGRRQEKG